MATDGRTELDPQAEAILHQPLHAVVSIDRDGKPPHMSVVWFDWDGAAFRFSTRRSRVKFRLLERARALSIVVDDPRTHRYVFASGPATASTDGHAELAASLRAAYLPDEPATAESEDDRVVVTMVPTRIIVGS